MTANVIINELANLPHVDGQVVLKARRDDFQVEVICRTNGYLVYGTVIQPNGGTWSNLAAERRTVHQARDLAARLWAEGKNFNVSIG
jgi:hypothetical protein